MLMKSVKLAAVAATFLATSASAESVIEIQDAYARASGMSAMAGAAFFVIKNSGDTDDQLIGVASDIANVAELHTHIMEDGVARMRKVEGGFAVPAGGEHVLQRGSDHVMFMGLTGAMEQGNIVTVTLTFREAGDITVEIPVDLERDANMGAMTMDGDDTEDEGMEMSDN